RSAKRERMLSEGEEALASSQQRLQAESERLEREVAGHGHAAQEAFALLAQLERREDAVKLRETELTHEEEQLRATRDLEHDLAEREQALGNRAAELEHRREELRRQELVLEAAAECEAVIRQ